MPLSACSSGTVTSASTSSAEQPEASVWISTRGGANSGKTSTGVFAQLRRAEDHHRRRGGDSTRKRNLQARADDPAHHGRIDLSADVLTSLDAELGSPESAPPVVDDGGAGRGTRVQDDLLPWMLSTVTFWRT